MIPRAIVLTGASGGLGLALVQAYARPGCAMLLFGRDTGRLEAAAKAARAGGAEVRQAQADMRDPHAFRSALAPFAEAHGLDLLILNAGVKTGNEAGLEPSEQTTRVLDVNLAAPIAQVQSALPLMDRPGQIALVSSLAARSPQADLLSYSASKAGLLAYATALRRALRGQDIAVSAVLPGFIDTPMTDRQEGPTPFKMASGDAAEKIRRGLARRAPVIAFPWQLSLLLRLQGMLPTGLSDRIDAQFRATIRPDRDEQS